MRIVPTHALPVLSASLLLFALAQGPAYAQLVTSGQYTGDGNDNRAITGVGFAPDLLIVKRDGGSPAQARSASMAAGVTKPISGGESLKNNRIESLDADGFTLGTHDTVNKSGDEYYWIAFQARPGQLVVDSYAGDGNDDRSISGLGFSPEFVMLMPEDTKRAVLRTTEVAGDTTLYFDTTLPKANLIQALEADGFQVGNDDGANKSGQTFHYAAWNAGPRNMVTGTYAGDGADDRDITGSGFTPDYVIVKSDDNKGAMHRPAVLGATDSSLHFENTANASNMIQALQSDGFQVGSDDRVNKSGDSFFWIAFKSFRRVMTVD